MRAPLAADLLLAWERGLDQPPTRRALELLATAMPQMALDNLSRLSIGKRDACLLSFRQVLFGNDVAALSQCPECGEKLDVTFNVDNVRLNEVSLEEMDAEDVEVRAQTRHLNVEDYSVTYRVPTSADILAITSAPGGDAESQY